MTTKDLAGNITSFSLNAVAIVCGKCGIPFSVPENFYNALKNNRESWFCPNGHERHFTSETEAERLSRLLRQKENELAQKITSNIQLESQLIKLKREVAKGKCPCCGKLYKHLANHMKNKHPKGI